MPRQAVETTQYFSETLQGLPGQGTTPILILKSGSGSPVFEAQNDKVLLRGATLAMNNNSGSGGGTLNMDMGSISNNSTIHANNGLISGDWIVNGQVESSSLYINNGNFQVSSVNGSVDARNGIVIGTGNSTLQFPLQLYEPINGDFIRFSPGDTSLVIDSSAGDISLQVFEVSSSFGSFSEAYITNKITLLGSISFSNTNGSVIGETTSEKLAFYGATPIVQPSNTTDLRQALINLGLYASGGATPLDLNGGTFTAGSISAASISNDISTQKIILSKGGVQAGTRKEINLIEGTGITLGVVDNSLSNRLDVTINSTGSESNINFSYAELFNATADWGAAEGGYYTITVSHNLNTFNCAIEVWDETNGKVKTLVDKTALPTMNTASISVPSTPIDGRFAGRIVVLANGGTSGGSGGGSTSTPEIIESVVFAIDGQGSPITTGSKGYKIIDYNCEVVGYTILASSSGTISLDIKKSSTSTFPTSASITNGNKLTLSSQQIRTDNTLTNWAKTFAANDIIEFVVDSNVDITKIQASIKVKRI